MAFNKTQTERNISSKAGGADAPNSKLYANNIYVLADGSNISFKSIAKKNGWAKGTVSSTDNGDDNSYRLVSNDYKANPISLNDINTNGVSDIFIANDYSIFVLSHLGVEI